MSGLIQYGAKLFASVGGWKLHWMKMWEFKKEEKAFCCTITSEYKCLSYLERWNCILCIDREDLVSGVDVNMGCPKEFSIKVSLRLFAEIMCKP